MIGVGLIAVTRDHEGALQVRELHGDRVPEERRVARVSNLRARAALLSTFTPGAVFLVGARCLDTGTWPHRSVFQGGQEVQPGQVRV